MGVQRSIYTVILATALLMPVASFAQGQQPAPPSASAQFTGQLAAALAEMMQQRDAALARVEELQKELDAAKKPVSEPKK